MVGQRWLADPLAEAAPANAFEARLDGASAVRVDLARMGIAPAKPVTATITTDGPLELRLAGSWAPGTTVTVGGVPVAATLSNGALVVHLPTGTSALSIVGFQK
jgi:hypothetical protein